MDQNSKINLSLKTCPSYFEALKCGKELLESELPGQANFVLDSRHVLKLLLLNQN